MKHYSLAVTFQAKENCEEKFVRELEESGIAATIRSEKGCIRYDFFYPAKKDGSVFLFEEWETRADQELHITQPHMDDMRAVKAKYILSTDLKVLE